MSDWENVIVQDWQDVKTDDWTEISKPKVSPFQIATTPIFKLITGKSIGERTNLLEKKHIQLGKEATERIIKIGRPPSTSEFFVKALPQATAQALINFFDLTPLDVGIIAATAGAGKIPIKGTTLGKVATTIPIKKGFIKNIAELGRYERTLKAITPLSSRGITQTIQPIAGITPTITKPSKGQAISKVNLSKYEPEIQEGIIKIINSNPDLLARKVISHAELEAMAQQLKSVPIVKKILSLPEGEMAAEILKLRQGEDAIIRSALKSAFDKLVGSIKYTIQLRQTQGVGRVATETGRALEQFKIPIQAQNEIANLINQKILQIKKDPTLGQDAKALISALVDLRKTVLSKEFNPTWFDKGYEFWINNILSGPWTHAVNETSNFMFGQIAKPIEKGVYSTIDKFLSLFTGKREHYYSEIPAQLKGIGMAIKREKLSIPIPKAGASKFTEYPGAIKGIKGKIIRIPTQLLGIEDNIHKRLVGFSELVARAEVIAKQEGLKGASLIARKNQLLANPTEKLIAEVQAEQLYRTFQDATGMGELLKSIRGIQGARWIQPFINTLSSIITKAVERTPAGFIKVGVKAGERIAGKISYPQKQVAIDLGNASIGTGLFALVYNAYKKETITGSAPKDKTKRDIFYKQGKQPYSILYQRNYIPFSRLEPYGTAMMQMTDFLQGYAESDKEIPISKLTDAIFKLSYSFANKTFLSGITNFVGMLSDPERYGETFLGRFAGGFVPFSGLARNVQQITDLTVREPEGIPEKVASGIPGLAKSVPQKVSSFGEKIETKPIGITRFLPFPITRQEGDIVTNELARLDMSVGYPTKKITFPLQKEGIKLNREEYNHLLVRSGGLITRNLHNLISSPYYQRLNNDVLKQKMIENLISQIRTISRTEIMLKKFPSKSRIQEDWEEVK